MVQAGGVDTELAHAKLTLTLRVLGVRANGYHELEAEMVSVDLADEVRFSEGDGLMVEDVSGGTEAVMPGPDNLVSRALEAVGRCARVRLVKRIPAGAGLGGGSSDAAAVLRWAGRGDDLALAASLGADVPFCLRPGRARVAGTGELVEPLPCRPDEAYTLVIPPVHVSTAAVYRAWDALGAPRGPGTNDLEQAALAVAPELATWRDMLGAHSGAEPRLAGSGSTWFVAGAFPEVPGSVVVRTVCPTGHACR
jgi:4-diphosphocytidyl-2-C-methyl-D-erythritol kinase